MNLVPNLSNTDTLGLHHDQASVFNTQNLDPHYNLLKYSKYYHSGFEFLFSKLHSAPLMHLDTYCRYLYLEQATQMLGIENED